MDDLGSRMVCFVTRDESRPALVIQFLAERGYGTIWCGDDGSAARWIADQRADVVIIDTRADRDLKLARVLLTHPQLDGAEVLMIDGDRIDAMGGRRLH
jgi:hypothetical protein